MEQSNTDQAARREIETLKKTVNEQQKQLRSLVTAIQRLEIVVRQETKKTVRSIEVGRRNREAIQVVNARIGKLG